MKILIIANPIASGGNAGKRSACLANILEKRGHKVEAYLTRFAGDGKDRVARVEDDLDRIVVVGGDGTFNEVLNGIPEDCSIPILQLPTGNANLLGQDLSLPQNPEETADLLENGRVISADSGTMNGLKFIMVTSAGFDAQVTEELKKVRTGKTSNLGYVLPVLRTLKAGSRALYTVLVDEQEQASGPWIVVSKVRSYGGICEMAYKAGASTGLLDIIVLPKADALSILFYFLWSKFSRIDKLKGVRYLQGRHIKISADAPIPMQIDGDFAGRHAEVDIQIKPAGIPLVVPAGSN